MPRRVLLDLLMGAMFAVGSVILLYGAYLALLVTGFPMPYDTAPPDPGSHPEWLAQVNLMALLAALPAFVAATAVAWALDPRSLADSLRRGLVWASVVLAWTLLITVGNGTTAMFATPGEWVFLAAFALGPLAAGVLRRARRNAAGLG